MPISTRHGYGRHFSRVAVISLVTSALTLAGTAAAFGDSITATVAMSGPETQPAHNSVTVTVQPK
jgi:hypothetical protein